MGNPFRNKQYIISRSVLRRNYYVLDQYCPPIYEDHIVFRDDRYKKNSIEMFILLLFFVRNVVRVPLQC